MFLLEPGKTYTVKLTVKNTSTRGGFPVAATLKVGISAGAGSTVLITAQEAAQEFSVGESRVFEYSLNVPTSVSGSGTIAAWVKDPAGNTLASGAEDVVIAAPVIPLGDIEILAINNIPFIEVGNDPYGVYGVLEKQIVMNKPGQQHGLAPIYVRWKNLSINFMWEGTNDAGFFLRYANEAGQQYPEAPVYYGVSGINPGGTWWRKYAPFQATATIEALLAMGYWYARTYTGVFSFAQQLYGQAQPGDTGPRFRVKNMLVSQSSGNNVYY